MCGWTLKVSAIAYAASAAITMIQPLLGNLLYAIIGLLGALMLLLVAGLDTLDTQHTIMPYGPLILVLFAAWNGYGSWSGIKAVMMLKRGSAGDRK